MSNNYTHYHDILLPKILQEPEVIYLRSINQKRLFARQRMRLIRKAVSKYCEKQIVPVGNLQVKSRKTTSFSIEIEFDHFIVSLRSSIEHLMQLINFISDLDLSPSSYNHNHRVDLDNVINHLKNADNTILCKLATYLEREKSEDWYKMLHKLRIELYHDKFEKFMVNGDSISLKLPGETETDLLTYSITTTANVERVLSYGLNSLIKFQGW